MRKKQTLVKGTKLQWRLWFCKVCFEGSFFDTCWHTCVILRRHAMGKRNIYTQMYIYICFWERYIYICRCIFTIIHACSIINWYWYQRPLKNKTLHVHIVSRKHYDHGWRHGWIKYCNCCSHCAVCWNMFGSSGA